MNLGTAIRAARTGQKLTLNDLSRMTRLTVSLLSQIENGKARPSIGSLLAISKALNTPIGALLEQDMTGRHPVTRQAERPVVHTASGITYHLLSDAAAGTPIEVLSAEYEKGASTEVLHSHEGVECGVVLQGKLEVEADGESYVLNQGDSITLKSNRPHKLNNLYDGRTVAVWVNSPPSF